MAKRRVKILDAEHKSSVLVADASELDALKTSTDAHIANGNIHVTAAKKTEWDAKAPGSVVNAVNNLNISVENLETKLQSEIAARTSGDTTLNNKLISHITDSDPAYPNVTHVTPAEKANWNARPTQVDLQAEIDRATAAETALNNAKADKTALATEVTRAQMAEGAITTDLTAHISDSIVHVSSSERLVWNAKANKADVDTEKDRAQTAESQLSTAITTEATRATAAETALGARIDDIENLGHYVGTFATKADLPATLAGATVNDFATVRADESQGGAITRYIIKSMGPPIQWDFEFKIDVDVSGKMDKLTGTFTAGNITVAKSDGNVEATLDPATLATVQALNDHKANLDANSKHATPAEKNAWFAKMDTVEHDTSLAGNGTTATPLKVNIQHNTTLTGSGTEADPLAAVAQPVSHDTTMTGDGVTTPLSVVVGSAGISEVTHDTSLTGSGTTSTPLVLNVQHEDSLDGIGTEDEPLKIAKAVISTINDTAAGLTAEVSNRTTQDTLLTNAINTEVSNREAAVLDLSGRITNEVLRATGIEGALQTADETEYLRAFTAENQLSQRITSLANLGHYVGTFNTKADLPTSLTTATVNDFATVRADETQGGAITRYVIKSLGPPIQWDFEFKIDFDASGKMDRLVDPTVGHIAVAKDDGNVEATLDPATLATVTALSTETSRAQGAESGLHTEVIQESTARTAGDTGLGLRIDGVENALTAHTQNTDIHVILADKTTWNSKLDTVAHDATLTGSGTTSDPLSVIGGGGGTAGRYLGTTASVADLANVPLPTNTVAGDFMFAMDESEEPVPFTEGPVTGVKAVEVVSGYVISPNRVAYSPDHKAYVAVGDSMIIRSTDEGKTWAEISTLVLPSKKWRAVAYGNGVFCVVSKEGDAVRSTDGGATWTDAAHTYITPLAEYCDMTYGDGVFMALSDGSDQNPVILYSNDYGVNWSKRNIPAPVPKTWCAIAYGDSRVIIIANTLPDATYAISTDFGVTWSRYSKVGAGPWLDIAYGNGMFVVATTVVQGSKNRIFYRLDNDGFNFNWVEAPKGYTGIGYGNGVFITLLRPSAANAPVGAYSTDGVTWTEFNIEGSFGLAADIHDVAVSSNNSFLGCAMYQGRPMFRGDVTRDLFTHSGVTGSPMNFGNYAAIGSDGNGTVIAVSGENTQNIARSTDHGETWLVHQNVLPNIVGRYCEVIYLHDGIWLIRANNNSESFTYARSQDNGVTWQAYTETLGFVGARLDTGRIWAGNKYTDDGVTWTEEGSIPATVIAKAQHPDGHVLGVFRYANKIIHVYRLASPTDTVWNASSVPITFDVTATLTSLIYADGKWVAAHTASNAFKAIYSVDDGLTWQQGTFTNESSITTISAAYSKILYVGGVFVCMSRGDTSAFLSTEPGVYFISHNGIDWYARNTDLASGGGAVSGSALCFTGKQIAAIGKNNGSVDSTIALSGPMTVPTEPGLNRYVLKNVTPREWEYDIPIYNGIEVDGIQQVYHDETLTGSGTLSSPLSVLGGTVPSVHFRAANMTDVPANTHIWLTPTTKVENGLNIDNDGRIAVKRGDVIVMTFPAASYQPALAMTWAIVAFDANDNRTQIVSDTTPDTYTVLRNVSLVMIVTTDGYVKARLYNESIALTSLTFNASTETRGEVHVARLTAGGPAQAIAHTAALAGTGTAADPLTITRPNNVSVLRLNDIPANGYVDVQMKYVAWEPIRFTLSGVDRIEAWGRWNDAQNSLAISYSPTGVITLTALGGGKVRLQNVSANILYGNLLEVAYVPSEVTLA